MTPAATTESIVDELRAAGLDPEVVGDIVRRALVEDLGPDGLDVTSIATIPAGQADVADVVARADGVVAGLAVAAAVFTAAAELVVVEDPDAASATTWVAAVPDGTAVARATCWPRSAARPGRCCRPSARR